MITKSINCLPLLTDNERQTVVNILLEAAARKGNQFFTFDTRLFIEGEINEEELRQEEINHPEETVHGRAFIKNFDD
tara:strand:+ start:232 stop:462 length:231 start_codon:yes stop_codon:yes gene_type:complete